MNQHKFEQYQFNIGTLDASYHHMSNMKKSQSWTLCSTYNI